MLFRSLKDVLWIPNLARNLLSVGCITDQHMSVEFLKDHFIIKDLKKHGEEVARGIRSNDKLYKLITMGGPSFDHLLWSLCTILEAF